MALGIVSDDDFESALNESDRKKKIIIIPELEVNQNNKEKVYIPEVINIKHGRGTGTKETPSFIRKLVASEAISGANVNELSELFNVSKSSISAYKNDATSTATYDEQNEELKRANDKVRNNIVGKAQQKLLDAISCITSEKLNDAKVNIASGVARDMSTIMRNVNPSGEGGSNNNNKVIIYRPRMNEEDDYDIIQVSE